MRFYSLFSQLQMACAVVGALSGLPSSASPERSPVLPTRSECISYFSVSWVSESFDEIEKAHSFLNDIIRTRVDNLPLAGLMFGNREQNYYVQYSARCQQKAELTEELLRRWRLAFPNLPSTVLGNERVTPSTKTIQVTGPAWRD